ncbi:DUF4291 family protein [Streptomyces nigra]|uniref:DUF4291 family protein n=1 Tax=Streptomyces nigra TaxID=1827580 RepID=UPI003F4D7653
MAEPKYQILSRHTDSTCLAGEAARLYADEWTVSITDITSLAHTIHAHVQDGDLDTARQLLPRESPYLVAEGDLAHLLH